MAHIVQVEVWYIHQGPDSEGAPLERGAGVGRAGVVEDGRPQVERAPQPHVPVVRDAETVHHALQPQFYISIRKDLFYFFLVNNKTETVHHALRAEFFSKVFFF